MGLVQESVERRFQQLVAGTDRGAIMTVLLRHVERFTPYRCQQLT